jgi:hypothetical protein
MARNRNNKTASLLKALNIEKLPDKPAVVMPEPAPPEIMPEPAPIAEPSPKKPRKNITKNMKLSEASAENPVIKAIPAEDRTYVRIAGERQIVSVPLMLINEQLGAAVERFNVCACNVCLRTITDKALDLMQPMYVRVVNSADEDEVNRLMRERRAEAIRVLAKVCISAPGKVFCDE